MQAKRQNISIFPLMGVSFIGTLGFSIMLPFLVYLVQDFKGNAFLYGALGAGYSFFQMIGAPILGRLSDTYGRKKILFICEAGSFLSWVIFFVALYLPVKILFHFSGTLTGDMVFTLPLLILFIARAVDGITAGDISVANAYMSDITDEQNLKKNYGRMAAAANIGFIFGPLLAGILGGTVMGLRLPIITTAAISLAAMFLIVFGLPDSGKRKIDDHVENRQKESRPGFSFLIGLPNVKLMIVLYFLIYLGFNFFYTSFPLYASGILNWNVTRLGIFFAVLSGEMVLVQGPLLSYLSKKVSDEKLTVAGGLILAANFVFMMSHREPVLYFAAFLFSLGNGLMWPSFLSILSRVAGHTYQGAIQGLAAGAGSLASIIGLIGGGILFHAFQEKTFLIAAVIIFIVFLCSFRLVGIKGKQKEETTIQIPD